jgi:hypothetical protein
MDLTLFKGMWQMPAIKNALFAGAIGERQIAPNSPSQNRQQRRSSKRSGDHSADVKSPYDAMEGGLALIGLLPHAIQARLSINGTDQMVWTSLKEDALVVSAADLTLKHGTAIAGTWNMLGILDALPDHNAAGELTVSGEDSRTGSEKLADSPFGEMMNHIMPFLRPLLGRPFSAYGMTPILIFREVSGVGQARI